MDCRGYWSLVGLGAVVWSAAELWGVVWQDDFEREPIAYRSTSADNVVTALQQRLDRGELRWRWSEDHGYLPALLGALDIPVSSQVLVFSKTSLQRERIGPKTPRAIYFNDDVYVGFCLGGEVMEVSAADPRLGTVFYTLEQEPTEKPRFLRQWDNCLSCHATSATGGVPGHLVRSVFPDRRGIPILSLGSYRTDHTSPLQERWGGWYVTGTHGRQQHMGNWVIENKQAVELSDNQAGQNVTDLRSFFTIGRYLAPHSDIVALMVLEHQTECHNRLTRALYETLQALHYEETLNRELGEPAGKQWEGARRRIRTAGEKLVQYLLFCEEAALSEPIRGTSGFAEEFARRGPFDRRGRSLRQLDLHRRLFKYPCSYLIYSRSFRELPAQVKSYVLQRLHEVLSGQDRSAVFAHLSAADRQAIDEILQDTLPEYQAVARSRHAK